MLRERMNQSLSALSEPEQLLMRLYFGLDGEKPLKLEQIGFLFDIPRNQIQQMMEGTILRLRRGTAI